MGAESWREQRDAALEELTERADALLTDRAIVHVKAVPHNDACAGENVLRLTLDDGSVVDIEGCYGGYSRAACDEYVELIDIREVPS